MKKIFIVVLCLISLASFADYSALIKKAGDSKKYPKADYIIIFDSTIVDVKETGLSYNNIHKLYKVMNEKGATHLNHLKFDYDPLSAFIEIKEVNIYRKNGEIESLDVSKVNDYPAPARMIYWGARQQMVDIGRLEPGDAIEVKMFKKGFTYALLASDNDDDRYIPPMRGHYYDIIEFWYNQPVLEKVYITKVPKTKDLTYKFFHGEVDTKIKDIGEKTKYCFTKRNMMPIKRIAGMVGYSDIAPKLLLTTSPDWEAKSLWFHGVNEDFGSFESTPEIDKKVAEILVDAKDEMDSISRLNHWVADNIRYSGISMGEGEGFTLHTGDMTFSDRCGVCKDKAGMLITFLRAAGFESYPAMTMAGSRIEDIPADQFNHSVTIVKLSNGEYKLLDPTWVPFVREEWSSLEQQQNYLMGLPDGADLMITPISPPENHPLTIKGESTILEDGTLEGSITIDADGQSDASIRGMFIRNWKANWEMAFEQELRSIAENMEIIESSFNNPYAYFEETIHITFKYRIPNFATVTEKEIIFTPVVGSNIFKRAQAHLRADTDIEERKYGFRDRCSRLVNLEETITLPTFKDKIYIPENDEIIGDVASFNGGYTLEENKLILKEEIKIEKRVFEANEWENYKSVVEAQNKFANEKVILSR
jgi:transglutaminase-like putative cysteine protease